MYISSWAAAQYTLLCYLLQFTHYTHALTHTHALTRHTQSHTHTAVHWLTHTHTLTHTLTTLTVTHTHTPAHTHKTLSHTLTHTTVTHTHTTHTHTHTHTHRVVTHTHATDSHGAQSVAYRNTWHSNHTDTHTWQNGIGRVWYWRLRFKLRTKHDSSPQCWSGETLTRRWRGEPARSDVTQVHAGWATTTERLKYLVRQFSGQIGFQAKTKDREILEEGGGAGPPSHLPRRDHE